MRKILIVIDMQNDFIDGTLGTPEAQAIVPEVKDKIKRCLTEKYDIVFTRDTHSENYLETNEGKNLPVPHCIKGTDGWQIKEELCYDDMYCVNKSTFGYLNWNLLGIDFNDVESIEIIGVCTDICVVSNALILKAMYPNIDIMVDASCCAGVTPETHKAALTTMKMCQINVIGE